MKTGYLGQLPVAEFLRNYWQQQPCVIRQAFPDYQLPLDEHDLAGLACIEDVNARLVQGNTGSNDWQVAYGPFSEKDFSDLPATDWTLLVRDVEKHYPPLQALLDNFYFLASWRIDDIMLSYAVNGGSVGPHVDQYDVFLLQCQGQRRWQIAKNYDPELLPDSELKVLRRFNAEDSWVLQPGDLLYLPPGVAHYGLALDSNMTCSVGLRAPSGAHYLAWLAEQLAQTESEGGFYTDPQRAASDDGALQPADLQALQDLSQVALSTASQNMRMAGCFLTADRQHREPAEAAHLADPETLSRYLSQGGRLHRSPWVRFAWAHGETPESAHLFAAGECFSASAELARLICSQREFSLEPTRISDISMTTLLQLLRRGFLLSHSQPEND